MADGDVSAELWATSWSAAWGRGDELSGFALVDARCILRILLEGRWMTSGESVTWGSIAERRGARARIDGETSWRRLTEYSGVGGAGGDLQLEGPSGIVSPQLINVLKICLPEAEWHLTLTRDAWDDQSPATSSTDEMLTRLLCDPAGGRAIRTDGLCGIALPPYGDSVVLSGEEGCCTPCLAENFEAYRVDPLARVEIWQGA